MNARARRAILSLMTKDTHKFGLEVGYNFPEPGYQEELQALQLEDWIRLIDVSPVHDFPGVIMRVFKVMPVAVEWLG